MSDRPSLERAIAGGLLGAAAGDALGSTVEFMSAEQIEIQHGIHREMTGGGAFGWEPGQAAPPPPSITGFPFPQNNRRTHVNPPVAALPAANAVAPGGSSETTCGACK